jgi:hypothetical protein
MVPMFFRRSPAINPPLRPLFLVTVLMVLYFMARELLETVYKYGSLAITIHLSLPFAVFRNPHLK